jgi:hypothetical protein
MLVGQHLLFFTNDKENTYDVTSLMLSKHFRIFKFQESPENSENEGCSR